MMEGTDVSDDDRDMSDEAIAQRQAEMLAAQDARLADLGEGTPRDGGKGDRVFTLDGQAWAVRVRVMDAIAPSVLFSSATLLAPQNIGLSICAAPLDAEGRVMKDDAGGVQLFSTSKTIQSDHAADIEYDPERSLMLAIWDHLTASKAQLATRLKVPDMLAAWAPRANASSLAS